jgi:LPS O-antigen subunit length determinant protein (WzzB/FepE family)
LGGNQQRVMKMSEENQAADQAGEGGDNRAAGIARGRMAAALVYVIKFQEEGSDSEIAAKYCTTPGKFKYITKEMRFTADEVKDAKDRFHASVNAENSTVASDKREEAVTGAHAALDKLETTTESQLTNARASDRKPRGKQKEGGEGESTESTETEDEEDEDLEELLENE